MQHIIDFSEVQFELGLSDTITEEERAAITTALKRAEGAVRRFLGYDPVLAQRTEYYPQRRVGSQRSEGVWEAEGNNAVFRELSESPNTELQLKHIPVRSIDSLKVDYNGHSGTVAGSFGADTEKTLGADYWPNNDLIDSDGNDVCSDGLITNLGAWPSDPGSIKVVYTAGYSSAELHGEVSDLDASPIADAVLCEAVRRAKRFFALKKHATVGNVPGVITSEHLGDYSYSIDAGMANQIVGGGDLTPESKEKLSSFVNMGKDL